MKRLLAFVLVIVMLLVIPACESNPSDENKGNDGKWPETVTMATGNPGGAAYYIGATQSQILDAAIDEVYFTVESTDGGFTMNGPFVQNDPDCLSMITISAMQEALAGEYPDIPTPLDKMRLIMAGNATKLQFVTLKESGITSLYDLKGKKIATSSPGSAVRTATLQVLEAMGYKESDFASITAMTLSDMGDALKDGVIDIGVFNGGVPGAAVSDLNSTRDIVMLQVPQDILDTILSEHTAYRTYLVTSEDYSDLTEDITVLGLPMGLACNADMDEELVYQITKILNESTEQLANSHTEGADWNTENSLAFYNDGSIPFHPGAARYYDEIQGK